VAERTGGSYLLDGVFGGTVGCVWCCYMPLWALTRSRVRQRLGIRGSLLEDLLVAGCLPPCYLAQSLNELDLAAVGRPGSFSAAAVAPQAPGPRVLEPLRAAQGGVRADALAAAAVAAHSGGASGASGAAKD